MKYLMLKLETEARRELETPCRTRQKDLLREISPTLCDKVLKAFAGFRTILGDLDDYQKLCLLYQMLCAGGAYDSGVRTKSLSHSYLGALKGLAVCEGYTELFFLLVCSLTDGYTPYRATGYIAEDISAVPEKDPGHSWLILRENASKQTWHCDPTWDLGRTQPRYFMKTDREMSGRIWATKYMPPCKEKFSRKIYIHKETLARLVAYYKSMPQRFESGDFTVL